MRKVLITAVGFVMLANAAFAEQKTEEKVVVEKESEKVVAPAPAPPAAAPAPAAPKAPPAAPAPAPAAPAPAQIAPDARVKSALDRMQLKHTLEARSTYRLVFNINDRRQNVFVDSHTEQFGGFEIRMISSTAYKVEGALPPAKAIALLEDNGRRKIGAWRIVSQGGSTYVVYAVQIPANADDALLRMAIAAAMQTADDMEKQETGKDEF